MNEIDIAALVLRASIGGTIVAHGWNHAFGGGRLAGTAGWFESIGIRPGRVHALLATLTEIGAGVMLLLGLLNALAAAAVIGTMTVALVAHHLRNGFFIFRPGEGYEYVLMIIMVSAGLGAIGAGRVSLDHLAGVDLDGWRGLLVALVAGVAGAAMLLAACWRPHATGAPASAETAET